MTDETTLDIKALIADIDVKEEEFIDILHRIDYATAETKKLWREIYRNAIDDRGHAYLLFADLYRHVCGNQQGHLNHGKQLSMYMERLAKANDQLLKLAELIDAAQGTSEDIDASALYNEFSQAPTVK